ARLATYRGREELNLVDADGRAAPANPVRPLRSIPSHAHTRSAAYLPFVRLTARDPDHVPDLGIFDEGVHAPKARDDQSTNTISKPLLERIGLDEHNERANHEIAYPDPTNRHEFLPRRQRGIQAEFPEVVSNLPFGLMFQGTVKPSDRSPDNQILVHGHIVIAAATSTDQTDLIIRIDTGMAHPGSVEIVPARNFIRDGIFRLTGGNARDDLGLEGCGNTLVRIHDQHPFRRNLAHPVVFLRAEAGPRPDDHLRAGGARKVGRPIAALGIHHDSLVGPGERGQAVLNVDFLVLGDHHTGDRGLSYAHEDPPPAPPAPSTWK